MKFFTKLIFATLLLIAMFAILFGNYNIPRDSTREEGTENSIGLIQSGENIVV